MCESGLHRQHQKSYSDAAFPSALTAGSSQSGFSYGDVSRALHRPFLSPNSDSRLGFALLYLIRSRILIFNPDGTCGSNADASSNIRRPRHRFRPQDVSIIRKDQVKSLLASILAARILLDWELYMNRQKPPLWRAVLFLIVQSLLCHLLLNIGEIETSRSTSVIIVLASGRDED